MAENKKYLKTPIARGAEASIALDKGDMQTFSEDDRNDYVQHTGGVHTAGKFTSLGKFGHNETPYIKKHGKPYDVPLENGRKSLEDGSLKKPHEKQLSDGKILTDEEIIKIWYFEKYKSLIEKADIEKAMHYEYNHSFTFDEVIEILKLKNEQFNALLEKRIKELDGAHNWKKERMTTEERDFAIEMLEDLKEMIK